ncbi:MAG: urea ABC transporter permease subunit UrtB, partial [Burkholderiaceae bacterium]|nr:urea ABC transporter permease subunit UrtB [Burkholderiaceae bacterium]
MNRSLVVFASVLIAANAYALSREEVKGIVLGESDARIEALNKAVAAADDRTAAFIQAIADDAVRVAGDTVFVLKADKAVDPVTGTEMPVPEGAEEIMLNNRLRGELDSATSALKLFSKDDKVR